MVRSGEKWNEVARKWRAISKEVSFMLKGEYSHNIDPKGRLIIPAKFRDDLGENFVITKGMEELSVRISGKRMERLRGEAECSANHHR